MKRVFLNSKKYFDYSRLPPFATFEIPPFLIELEEWLNIEVGKNNYHCWYDHTRVVEIDSIDVEGTVWPLYKNDTDYYYIDFKYMNDAVLFKLTWG